VRVLGIDPGLARTGVAVVEGARGNLQLCHADCLETGADEADARRLAALLDSIERLVAAHRPDVAAVEQLFFATNRRSAMRVGEARGVILCALARRGVAVHSYTPLQVKEALTGFGAAPKTQVARMTRALLGVASIPGGDDTTDACAVAVCHLHRARLAVGAPAIRAGVASARLQAAIAVAQGAQPR